MSTPSCFDLAPDFRAKERELLSPTGDLQSWLWVTAQVSSAGITPAPTVHLDRQRGLNPSVQAPSEDKHRLASLSANPGEGATPIPGFTPWPRTPAHPSPSLTLNIQQRILQTLPLTYVLSHPLGWTFYSHHLSQVVSSLQETQLLPNWTPVLGLSPIHLPWKPSLFPSPSVYPAPTPSCR